MALSSLQSKRLVAAQHLNMNYTKMVEILHTVVAAQQLNMNYTKMAEILHTAKCHPNMAICLGSELASGIS